MAMSADQQVFDIAMAAVSSSIADEYDELFNILRKVDANLIDADHRAAFPKVTTFSCD